MGTSNSIGVYKPGKPSIDLLITVALRCSIYNGLPLRQKNLVQFKLSGSSSWYNGKYEVELIPSNSDIILSTYTFNAKAGWVIQAYVTCNSIIENPSIKVNVDGKESNTISLKFMNRDKDVFSEEEVQKLIDENSSLIRNDKVCFRVADKGISKLLNTTSTVINSYGGENSYTRANTLKSQGYIKDEIIINQYSFDTGGVTKPKKFASGKGKTISESLDKTIGNRIGYHVYYFSILKGYHVLLLVIDSSNSCVKKFKAYDQLKDRGDYLDYEEINEFLLEMTVNNWEGSANRNKDKTANTEIAIWKVKRK
ncbi:hypothetical protein ACM39_18605 [Chryseobacterium sp. FH2]|uniref:hypothetical protein n=1 Tax=Chryseobacterium sp. FH2 TaxID=1674291 RepID=UPI00065B0204|nr:hypothetical protein [Chryseobacterium sp. FH2]KMQ58401.1 hypothetical protein ACM39_18605 [Chryseobacterium sp. FH2]